ncbi:MAG: hypothetical protein ACTSXG_01030, partial [Alphaproteobacteria bacterium]
KDLYRTEEQHLSNYSKRFEEEYEQGKKDAMANYSKRFEEEYEQGKIEVLSLIKDEALREKIKKELEAKKPE